MDELLNHAPCGFLSLADDGTMLAANATLLAMLGYDLAELEGRHVNSILSVASRIFYQSHLFPLLKLNDAVEEIYLTLRTRQGADVSVLLNAVRRERDGAFINDCVVMKMRQRNQYEDEILRAKKAAEDAARAKDEFLAAVSHDLRTPLTSVLGWVVVARTSLSDEAVATSALDSIERSARTQARLIEDILDFSRIASGKLRLEIAPVWPAEVIRAAVGVLQLAVEAKGIALQVTLDEDCGPVAGDADRLQQVMWNLLSNAVKFAPEGGRIGVRLERIDAHAVVTVSDDGQGITGDLLPFVFERFRQADYASARRQDGLGLGLSITRNIVELHGGAISVRSEGAGQGATFTVQLPLVPG